MGLQMGDGGVCRLSQHGDAGVLFVLLGDKRPENCTSHPRPCTGAHHRSTSAPLAQI